LKIIIKWNIYIYLIFIINKFSFLCICNFIKKKKKKKNKKKKKKKKKIENEISSYF